MKQFTDALPFILLVTFPLKFIVFVPNIADALALIAIAALCGIQYYLQHKQQPNYLQQFKEELEKVKLLNNAEMTKVNGDINELKEIYGKYSVKISSVNKSNSFEF